MWAAPSVRSTRRGRPTSSESVGLELLLVSRNLQRVGDLATNIAEDVVFVAEGKTIKHHAEDGAQEPLPAPE